MPKIKVALIGVGNCASSLLQGIQYCKKFGKNKDVGLRKPCIGGLYPEDIQVVAAFDVDARKVGKDLAEAVFALPNNAPKVIDLPATNVIVGKGPVLDGIGEYTKEIVNLSPASEEKVEKTLSDSETEIVLNLLPSGAEEASQFYAEQAIAASCAFINATPTFVASSAVWSKRFEEAGLPLAGDDIIDQIGSTALHKTMLKLLSENGVKITETYQLDVGGSTESLNTLERTRDTKRTIKTSSVASALPYETEVVAGSTDYVDFLQNKRDSYFWISGLYFCKTPLKIDMKFSTIDAPNAGSTLFDAIRAMKLALNRNLKGPIEPICAYAFKKPPKRFSSKNADEMFEDFIK